jgi:hypothetical protein
MVCIKSIYDMMFTNDKQYYVDEPQTIRGIKMIHDMMVTNDKQYDVDEQYKIRC